MKKGDIFIADLNPVKGSEQKGKRPVIIFQNDFITRNTNTAIIIPITTNLKRANLRSCVLVEKKDSGLPEDSVALCFQMRVLDKSRLEEKICELKNYLIEEIEISVLYTLGIYL